MSDEKKPINLTETADAMIWAQEFVRTKFDNGWSLEDVDESLMVGWFASAMQAAVWLQTAALEKRLAEAEAELSRKDECIVDGLMQRKDLQSRLELAEREADTKLIAALAHRGCCGTEHNPDQGKLHGYCVVCGVPWPCDIAKAFIDAAMQESRNE